MIRSLLLLSTAVLGACALDIAGPRRELTGLPEGLEVRLRVEPAEVARHEPFTAELSMTNTTADTIRIVTSHGCLFLPSVIRGGKRIPFKGSAWACTAAITTHTFAPGEAVTRNWEMRAELYAEEPDDRDGAPAPKGAYLVQAEFEIAPIDQSGRNPVVEAPLRVR